MSYETNPYYNPEVHGLTIVGSVDCDGGYGFDMFVVTREQALSVPRSMFVIGQTWWDYWLPWSCSRAGHRLTTINDPVIFHRRHPLNYAHLDWLRMTHHFCWLTGRSTMIRPQQVSGEIHAAINKAIQP